MEELDENTKEFKVEIILKNETTEKVFLKGESAVDLMENIMTNGLAIKIYNTGIIIPVGKIDTVIATDLDYKNE